MNSVFYIIADICGIILILLLHYNYNAKLSQNLDANDKLFPRLVLINILVLLFDIFVHSVDEKIFFSPQTTKNIAICLYFVLQSSMFMVWLWYCNHKVGKNNYNLKRDLVISFSPFFAIVILTLIIYLIPFLFEVFVYIFLQIFVI